MTGAERESLYRLLASEYRRCVRAMSASSCDLSQVAKCSFEIYSKLLLLIEIETYGDILENQEISLLVKDVTTSSDLPRAVLTPISNAWRTLRRVYANQFKTVSRGDLKIILNACYVSIKAIMKFYGYELGGKIPAIYPDNRCSKRTLASASARRMRLNT